jgi:hypothetical protein
MSAEVPMNLRPFFQEYDLSSLNITRDADLIIQRTLEFGNWENLRWLFAQYKVNRIRRFLRQRGERMLKPVTFNYWRKLLGIRQWQKSPFPTIKGELWKY